MYKRFRASPLLTFAAFFALQPSLASAQDVVEEEEVVEEDEVVEDVVEEDEVVDDEVVDDEEIADDEEIVGDDEEVVAEEEDVVEDDEDVLAAEDEVVAEEDEEVAADDSAVEEGIFEPGEEPWREPAAGNGVVWGRLTDIESGEPALEAQVKVKETGQEVFTDFDGYYRLELPPGKYNLEIFYELYEPATLQGVTVQQGVVNRVDEKLKPQVGAIEEEIIVDEAETQTVEGLALARQRSVSQGDAIGREEISKGTDSNAAQAAQRVVGANIVGGRFVYVRGLGERYSNSLLSGYPLPSPEPDKAAVPLDVFPAAVLDSLTIAKTFTPDMPGDFAGGSVRIETRSVPKEPLFQVSVSGGFNSQTTGHTRLNYPGSPTDFMGFDNGQRNLPDSVPSNQRVVSSTIDPNSDLSEDEVTDIGQDVNGRMHPRTTGTPINHGFSVVGGNTWKFGNGQALGVLASVNYSRKYQIYRDMVLKEYWVNASDDRGFAERINYRVDAGEEKIRWGAFGKVSYIINDKHKLMLTGLHSQLADKETNEFTGNNIQSASRYTATQLLWVERGMSFGMLSGRHEFDKLNDAEFGWDVSASGAFRDEPDRRDTVYQQSQRLTVDHDESPPVREPGWFYLDGDESGRHFWANQKENSFGGKLDWMQPLLKDSKKATLNLKVGGLVNAKNREFAARRLILRPAESATSDTTYYCLGDTYQRDCPEKLFQDDNIPDLLDPQENPQPGDAYDANLNVYAGYVMLDWEPTKMVRIAGGGRVEFTDQGVNPLDPLGTGDSTEGADLNTADFLPALSFVLSMTKKTKTRLSYSRTLARPQVRELAPFGFSDYFGGRVVTGNPDLVLTSIDNFDMRFEFWPSLTEILAFSVFYKYLQDPIEQTLIPADTAPQVTFINADKANVIGIELEARKNLGFLTKVLNDFSVNANLTLTHSRTEVPQTGNLTITSPSRPLVNQAPWVVNAALDYDNADTGTTARLAYNINAPTLVEVGTDTIPDGYLQPFHSLDFAVGQKFLEHFKASLSVENIINDQKLWTQGNEINKTDDGNIDTSNVLQMYRYGRTVSLSLGYEL